MTKKSLLTRARRLLCISTVLALVCSLYAGGWWPGHLFPRPRSPLAAATFPATAARNSFCSLVTCVRPAAGHGHRTGLTNWTSRPPGCFSIKPLFHLLFFPKGSTHNSCINRSTENERSAELPCGYCNSKIHIIRRHRATAHT